MQAFVALELRGGVLWVRAVDAVTIETHGFGIREETWQLIEKAYQTKGIIVFTDPDTAGEQIRRRIMKRFPEAKEAFLIDPGSYLKQISNKIVEKELDLKYIEDMSIGCRKLIV